MGVFEFKSCPLCKGEHFVRVMECVDHYASGETFSIYKCANCGLLFTKDVPDEKSIGRYYSTPDYISHSDTRSGIVNTVYHWVRAYMLSRKAILIENLSGLRSGKLLDIGTGTGYFPHKMKERGWNVNAIEKDATTSESARIHFGIDVYTDFFEAPLADDSFDVVTLWHVLEHIEPLNQTLQRIRGVLKDKGLVFVAVPNHTSYDAEYYHDKWAAYDVPRHLWHFSPKTMRHLVENNGFSVIATYPMPFDAFYVSALTEKNVGHSFSFVRGMTVGFLCWMRSVTQSQRSSSLIYVLKKVDTYNEK